MDQKISKIIRNLAKIMKKSENLNGKLRTVACGDDE